MSRRKDGQFLFKIRGYYLHHSLAGLALILFSLLDHSMIFFYLGLGIVVGHGCEEIYFGRKDLKTFFTLVST